MRYALLILISMAFFTGAIVFNGTDAQINDSSLTGWYTTNKTAYTMECWIKLPAINSRKWFFQINTDVTTYATLAVDYGPWADNRNYCHLIGSNGIDCGNSGSEDFVADTWYHIAGTWDGSTAKTYVNGVLSDTDGSTTSPLASTSRIGLGQDQIAGLGFCNIIVDEVRIWKVARTQAEISALMDFRIIPQQDDFEGDLIGLWRFDEGAINLGTGGKTAVDWTMNGADMWDVGTITYDDGAPITWNRGN